MSHAADNMVKVRVTDLRFVALALLLLASLTTAAPVKKSPPWHNPCDVAFTAKTRRHVSSETIKSDGPLVTQLKITRDNFCHEWMKAASIYHQIEEIKKPFHNLPSNTLSWYNKVKTEKHPRQTKETLHNLHVNLQKFLIGLESMKQTDDLLILNSKKRDNFFHEVSNGAKLLLCEVETFVNTSDVEKPEPQPAYDPCLYELSKGTAVTLGCEKSFFSLYSSFLDDWNAIFDKNSNKNPKRCVKHREKKRENRKAKNRGTNKRRHKRKQNRTTP